MRELEKQLWSKGYRYVAGVDEAGRGPLAGPVVAAAVVLPQEIDLQEIKDSKKLTAKRRRELADQIYEIGLVGIGTATHTEIDQLNILQATFLAMQRAVAKLQTQINLDFCIVDGNQTIPGLFIRQQAVVKADASCSAVAAASIVAKVYRDALMQEYDLQYPEYGFAQHKGYPTKRHLAALAEYGPSPIHRISFARVKGGVVS
ncbi:MAG: ribonuclease HII [Firmicutes bacterium]|jgi:ribonuclease HII|nr:ribonuclease HII [Bacillota bacterium]